MKFIGRQINVGFGKETTRGTAVAVASWTPKTNMDFDEKHELVQDESSIGVIVDANDSHIVRRWAEGNIEGNINVNNIGYALLSLMGNVSSAETAGTGAYQHDFTLENSNQHQSLTIGVNDPIGDYSFPLSMIESMTISAEVGGFATYTATFKSKEGESTTHTVSYTTDYSLLAKNGVFKLASDLSGLDAANQKCIQSFEITITKNLEDHYCISSVSPEDFINKQFMIEGSFTAVYENEADYKNTALAGTKQAIRFTLEDTNTTIGVSDNPTLEIDLAKASFTEWTKTQGNDEVVSQTVSFKGLYDTTNASAISMKLINTNATY